MIVDPTTEKKQSIACWESFVLYRILGSRDSIADGEHIAPMVHGMALAAVESTERFKSRMEGRVA